ncbi:MAG: N-(5'-phosphoribosyl)anthranilate isomerase [Aliishimia sp.]
MAITNYIPAHLTSVEWLDHIFSSKTAMSGGVVRRKSRDVERIVGRDLFREELRRRGYRAIENGPYFVIFCNRLPMRMFE